MRINKGLPRWHSGKGLICLCRRHKRHGFDPWVKNIPWSRKRQPAPILLPGIVHWTEGPGRLYPWGRKELNITEWLSMLTHIHTHTHTHTHTHMNKAYLLKFFVHHPCLFSEFSLTLRHLTFNSMGTFIEPQLSVKLLQPCWRVWECDSDPILIPSGAYDLLGHIRQEDNQCERCQVPS